MIMFDKDNNKKTDQASQSKNRKHGPNEKKDTNPSANRDQKQEKSAGGQK
jgi:hypothetical protein